MDSVGWVQDIIVNRRSGRLVDGRLRLTLALERGEPAVPVVYVDLAPDKEALVLATLDPLAELAELVFATERERLPCCSPPPRAATIRRRLRKVVASFSARE